MKPRLLVFAGSLRSQSWNKKLARAAADAAQSQGAEATYVNLNDYPMPLFDEDLEAQSGMPATAQKLKRLMLDHHGFLIASPEYNSSITAVLKNTIDWVSRKGPGDLDQWPFGGKIAGIMSASPGVLGGLRGLVHLRMILGNIQTIVIPTQLAIIKAHEAFDPAGKLKDQTQNETLSRLVGEVIHLTRGLNQTGGKS